MFMQPQTDDDFVYDRKCLRSLVEAGRWMVLDARPTALLSSRGAEPLDLNHPVVAFLSSVQLQGYSALLIENHRFDTVQAMVDHIHSEEDLSAIGIRPLAHKRALMAAIRKVESIVFLWYRR